MSDLVLPGTIPGLLRVCSPVVGIATGDRGTVYGLCAPDHRGPVVQVVHNGSGRSEAMGGLPASIFALDLTDATGRAHAGWWLDAACDRCGTWAGVLGWRFQQYSEVEHRFGPWTTGPNGYTCPALATLDDLDDPPVSTPGKQGLWEVPS